MTSFHLPTRIKLIGLLFLLPLHLVNAQPPSEVKTINGHAVIKPGGVKCKGIGNPYIENSCIAGIDKYLSRSIMMHDLASLNHNRLGSDVCHNSWIQLPLNASFQPVDHFGNSHPPLPNNTYCSSSFSNFFYCPWEYCPQRSQALINELVNINASFVKSVAMKWGNENQIVDNHAFMVAVKQTADDINDAYDCKPLRRPILQAFVAEHVESWVNQVEIPTWAWAEFIDEFPHLNTIPNHAHFDYTDGNMAKPCDVGNGDHHNVISPYTRMWLYYAARKYIDAGYTALHFGAMANTLPCDPDPAVQADALHKISELYDKIREYASTKPTKFVIISGDYNMYDPVSGKVMVDFNITPYRPEEQQTQPSECDGSYYAKLVEQENCTQAINQSGGGISPIGCNNATTPYSLDFDNMGGAYETTTMDNYPPILEADQDCWKTWQCDENFWWTYGITTDECRNYVLEDYYCNLKSLEDSKRGYAGLPGRLVLNPWPTNYWHLTDHPDVKAKILNLWTPNEVTDFTYSATCYEAIGWCNGEEAGKEKYNRLYHFYIPNPDCSTVYTWHIFDQTNQTWLPFTYGSYRDIVFPTTHVYQVSLRQDNWGFDNMLYPYGVKDGITYQIQPDVCCIWPYDPPNYIDYTTDDNFIDYTTDDNFRRIHGVTAYHKYIEDKLYYQSTDDQITQSAAHEVSYQPTLASQNPIVRDVLKVYPNPTNDMFKIFFQPTSNGDYSIVLKNILGQTIKTLAYKVAISKDSPLTLEANAEFLPSGTYLIEIIDVYGRNQSRLVLKN